MLYVRRVRGVHACTRTPKRGMRHAVASSATIGELYRTLTRPVPWLLQARARRLPSTPRSIIPARPDPSSPTETAPASRSSPAIKSTPATPALSLVLNYTRAVHAVHKCARRVELPIRCRRGRSQTDAPFGQVAVSRWQAGHGPVPREPLVVVNRTYSLRISPSHPHRQRDRDHATRERLRAESNFAILHAVNTTTCLIRNTVTLPTPHHASLGGAVCCADGH